MKIIMTLPEGTNPVYAKTFVKELNRCITDSWGEHSVPTQKSQYVREAHVTITFEDPMGKLFGMSIDVTGASVGE
jgi:hypothetical protein